MSNNIKKYLEKTYNNSKDSFHKLVKENLKDNKKMLERL